MKKLLLAAAACAALSAPAHSGTDEPTLADFNALFNNTVAMGKQIGAPIERFNETNEVGWEQIVIVGDVAVKIVVIVSPPTTFAIKHLCTGNTRKPTEMLCTSNLGETWVDTKDAAGAWHQGQIVNLSWRRDLAAIAFD
jgi:hypothetical protein